MQDITQITESPDLGFDPHTPAFARDPHSVYAALRCADAPYHMSDFGGWVFSRFADVSAIATNPNMVRGTDSFLSDAQRAAARRAMNWQDMPNHQALVQVNLLESDGATHQRLRKTVFGAFTRSYVERYRTMVQAYADKMVDRALETGEIDFTADIACHMPGHIIGNILGVPDDDCPQLRIWSEDVVQFFDLNRTAEDKARAERATGEFRAYLQKLVQQRRKAPREDILSRLITAQDAGTLTEVELIATAMLILMAGHGSTIDVMGTGLHALLTHPDQTAQLRADPTGMNTAVQEMFRYDTPLPFFHRYAADDVSLAGYHIPKGTKLGLLYAAANRDEAAFPNAHLFNAKRTPNRHLAFGSGAHLCLGNHLSRLDMEVLFTTLLRRTKSIELASDQVIYKPGLSVRGPKALPVRLIAA